MKLFHPGWVLTLVLSIGAASSFACSAKLTAEEGDGAGGSGETDETDTGDEGSGGRKPGAGGSPSGGAGSGGKSGDGGGAGSGGKSAACEDGEEEPCADHSGDYPMGSATCEDGEWDVSACMFCEPDAEVACASVDETTPDGMLVCDEDGRGWLEEPEDACEACDEDGAPADCDSSLNPTDNRGGTAPCTEEGRYDYGACTLCDEHVAPPSCDEVTDGARPVGIVTCDDGAAWDDTSCAECDPRDYEATIDCVDLPVKEHEFTGGRAYCGVDGAWDQGTCEYCGDGIVNGTDQCEVADSVTTTCDALGYVNTDEAECGSSCRWSTAECTHCPGPKCFTGGSCSGASCDGKECSGSCDFRCNNGAHCEDIVCGVGSECDFACFNGGSECENAVCKPGADCEFQCYNGGRCEDVVCTGATCSFNCENSGSVCSTLAPFTCLDGQTCEFDCRNGGDCSGVEVICEAGSTCEIDCDNNGSKCIKATCEAGADCSLSCQNSTCPSVQFL